MPIAQEAYHIHIDGPVLPGELKRHAFDQLGFRDDDFPHSIKIGDETCARPSTQLSRIFRSRSDREHVHLIFRELQARAVQSHFKGYIQAEFVMSERYFGKSDRTEPVIPALPRLGMRFDTREIDLSRSEVFKKHEIHLELERRSVPDFLFEELSLSGMIVAEFQAEVTFTASGDPDSVGAIRRILLRYLTGLEQIGVTRLKGRLISEATVAHSLHEVHPRNTTRVVDESTLSGV